MLGGGDVFPALVPQERQDGVISGESVEELSETSCLVAFVHLLNDIFWKIFAKRPGNPSIAPVVNPGERVATVMHQPHDPYQ